MSSTIAVRAAETALAPLDKASVRTLPPTFGAKVVGNLYRIATGSGREAVTAAIFWLKVRAGWREPLTVREYPMGKKEARELAARTAAVGTPWEDLLKRHEALTASDAEYR